MNSLMDLKKENLARSSMLGVGMKLSLQTFIYPLEMVKLRLHCSQDESKILRIALAIFRQEGIGAFYIGLAPQLLKTSIKQVWCWPMITGMPSVLKKYQIENLAQQVLTGLSIALIDALISTPLEGAKIRSLSKETRKFCFTDIYKEGWKGFTTNWSKLSVCWVTFLTAQKCLRDRSSALSGQDLSFSELTKIGVQVALIVSLVSAPFDVANTLKLAQNSNPVHILRSQGIFKFYRGWPLSTLSLIINNIASIILIDKLGKF